MTALVAAISLSLTACGASAAPTALATGTVAGRVTAGPTCPVERPDQPCPPAPVSARVQAKNALGRIAASTRTDAAGRYVLELLPGMYTVYASTPNVLPKCEAVRVIVRARQTTRAPISCESGIR
jgi:hypothetical protein